MAISAWSFLNSSSSSSSSTAWALDLPLTVSNRGGLALLCFYMPRRKIGRSGGGKVRKGRGLRGPSAAAGILVNESDTGTVPVFNIFSSSFSCSSAARSASSSSSSTGSVMGIEVMALPISWVSSCCSRSCSLEGVHFSEMVVIVEEWFREKTLKTYMVTSTSSMVILP